MIAIATVSSCAASSVGSDVVAKVNDATLTFDDLAADELVPAAGGDSPALADGDSVRAQTTKWVRAQLATESKLGQSYATAYAELGVVCADLMPAPEQTPESVDEVVARIEAEGWTLVATEYEQTTGGQTTAPCSPVQGITPVFAEALSAAAPGVVVPIKDTAVGYGVIRVRPFDEVDQEEFVAIVAQVDPGAVESLTDTSGDPDVYVNPRVGTYSPATLAVEPIG